MSKLYFIGGYTKSSYISVSSCYTYDINSNIWNKIANLNKVRYNASCTVFESKIVVTGGFNYQSQFKYVEAYYYCENKWTCLPDMIEKKLSCCS